MEYTIVSGTKEVVVYIVNTLLKNGWVPQGGVCRDGSYIQAMIRYESKSQGKAEMYSSWEERRAFE